LKAENPFWIRQSDTENTIKYHTTSKK